MPSLYVIRHAQPAITGVLLGQSDPTLSSGGRNQAATLRIPECVVYSSPLRRARETAEFLTNDFATIPDLAEISYGRWDGLSWREIESRWPDLAGEKLLNWRSTTPPGGESWSTFRSRVCAALAKILEGALPAAIVAHEAVNGVIAELIHSTDVSNYKQDYCEIRHYEVSPELRSRIACQGET